jgi:hypothetical protein
MRRSKEPYKWWIRKICRSKGTTGISNLVASQGITATSTAIGIGQDEAPIPLSSSDHRIATIKSPSKLHSSPLFFFWVIID